MLLLFQLSVVVSTVIHDNLNIIFDSEASPYKFPGIRGVLYIIFITAVLLLFKLSVIASTITDILYITIVSEASMCLFSAVGEGFLVII